MKVQLDIRVELPMVVVLDLGVRNLTSRIKVFTTE
jgi:hypothetical protein